MSKIDPSILNYLKAYDGWCISIKQLKEVFAYCPASLDNAIQQGIKEGKLIRQPNKRVLKVNINGKKI